MTLDYDALESAGHDLTLVAPMLAGVSTYVCENCGMVFLSGYSGHPPIIHAPRYVATTEAMCISKRWSGPPGPRVPSLGDKIRARLYGDPFDAAPEDLAEVLAVGPPRVHVLHHGRTMCGVFAGMVPRNWPDGHRWVSLPDLGEATCPACRVAAGCADAT